MPEITHFCVDKVEHNTSSTVNESDDVRMVCIVDSNPMPTIKITFKNKTLSFQEHPNTLEHLIRDISCTDTGIYVCSGLNDLNKHGTFSSKQIRLYVNCKCW